MTDTIEQLSARLAVIEHKEAIRRLKARYLRASDLKDVATVCDCFAPGPVRIAYQGFPEFTDRDAFVAVYEEMACRGGVYDLHHATNWDIDLEGADLARGRWSLAFRTIIVATRQVTRLAVEYDDRYRRVDGRWWITESVSRITSVLTEEIGADGTPRILAWGAPPG